CPAGVRRHTQRLAPPGASGQHRAAGADPMPVQPRVGAIQRQCGRAWNRVYSSKVAAPRVHQATRKRQRRAATPGRPPVAAALSSAESFHHVVRRQRGPAVGIRRVPRQRGLYPPGGAGVRVPPHRTGGAAKNQAPRALCAGADGPQHARASRHFNMHRPDQAAGICTDEPGDRPCAGRQIYPTPAPGVLPARAGRPLSRGPGTRPGRARCGGAAGLDNRDTHFPFCTGAVFARRGSAAGKVPAAELPAPDPFWRSADTTAADSGLYSRPPPP
ncbi:hypothetical protein H4R21_001775, partial [Coemansia helicoidea]